MDWFQLSSRLPSWRNRLGVVSHRHHVPGPSIRLWDFSWRSSDRSWSVILISKQLPVSNAIKKNGFTEYDSGTRKGAGLKSSDFGINRIGWRLRVCIRTTAVEMNTVNGAWRSKVLHRFTIYEMCHVTLHICDPELWKFEKRLTYVASCVASWIPLRRQSCHGNSNTKRVCCLGVKRPRL